MSLTPVASQSSWQVLRQPIPLGRLARGKRFRHALLIDASMPRTPRRGPQWNELVGRELERTLQCLVGPEAPLAQLLEVAELEALRAWPPPADPSLSVWVRRIACGVALRHLAGRAVEPCPVTDGLRPGGVREVLTRLHARLRAVPPEEQVAFCLLELNGSSVSEAAAVLGVSTATILRRVARVRRQLLFAARRDRLLLRYLCIARRLQAMTRRLADRPSGLPAE
jgi:DNA-directed RNA polymerase specialized sigma24 family protein